MRPAEEKERDVDVGLAYEASGKALSNLSQTHEDKDHTAVVPQLCCA